ncbi:MAG: alpha/beta hydrolase, partial [Chloroflexota bacterium]|nr:alpha/beta hydrolase [Chloroflexota bacterium]
VTRVALIGCGAGASLAIAAGSASEAVTGVAAIAPDATALEFVADLAPRRLLLIHGAADTVTPADASRILYVHAGDPKELVILPGGRHDLIHSREEALDKLTAWTRDLLRNPFKPRRELPDRMEAALMLASRDSRRDLALPGVR